MKDFSIVAGLLPMMTLIGASYGQAVIQAGESSFVVRVKGGPGVSFRGSLLVTANSGEAKTTKIEGNVPAEFTFVGTSVFLSVQNQTAGGKLEMRVDTAGKLQLDKASLSARTGQFLEVELSQNGTTIKKQRTDAPHGVIGLASTMPAGGAAQQTELQVDGTVKFAFLTLTSETGDTEQMLVPIPFSKTFYPRVGWIVGLSAQKTRTTRPDPGSFVGNLELLDDGTTGSLHVAIRVNGGILGQSETTEPFGVATATVRIP